MLQEPAIVSAILDRDTNPSVEVVFGIARYIHSVNAPFRSSVMVGRHDAWGSVSDNALRCPNFRKCVLSAEGRFVKLMLALQ